MNLSQKFKRDYINYFLSISLPAIITAVSIPLLKNYLGAVAYGEFSLLYNGLLIYTTISTAWINQSASRFNVDFKDKLKFINGTLRITAFFLSVMMFPAFFIAWKITADVILALLVLLSFLSIGMQFTLMVNAQSNFLSSKTIVSETVRTGINFILAWTLLIFFDIKEIYCLFISAFLAFGISSRYLYVKLQDNFQNVILTENTTPPEKFEFKKTASKFFAYGFPLSIWFVIVYLFSYIDKVLMLEKMGGEVQGNYQAIFDLLSRGLTLIISPVLITLMPLLSVAHAENKSAEINKLLKKIVFIEWLVFCLVAISYYLFGSDVLFYFLKVPQTSGYEHLGFILIAGTFVWQMAMVVNKTYELKLQTLRLVKYAISALVIQAAYYYFLYDELTGLHIAFGYFISAFVYFCLVSFPFLNAIKVFKIKMKDSQ